MKTIKHYEHLTIIMIILFMIILLPYSYGQNCQRSPSKAWYIKDLKQKKQTPATQYICSMLQNGATVITYPKTYNSNKLFEYDVIDSLTLSNGEKIAVVAVVSVMEKNESYINLEYVSPENPNHHVSIGITLNENLEVWYINPNIGYKPGQNIENAYVSDIIQMMIQAFEKKTLAQK